MRGGGWRGVERGWRGVERVCEKCIDRMVRVLRVYVIAPILLLFTTPTWAARRVLVRSTSPRDV